MKYLKHWVIEHPFKAVGFTFLFTIISALIAICDSLLTSIILAAAVIFWIASFLIDTRHMLALLLCLCILTPARAEPPPREEPLVAGVAAGVVVICVGTFCVIKIVKFCQKHFPKTPPSQTNASPEITVQETGAAFSYIDPVDCHAETGLPTTFTMTVTPGTPCSMTIEASHESQSLEEFAAEVAERGLTLDCTSYERDSKSVESVPLSFNDRTVQLAPFAPYRIIMERSYDLQTWEPFVTVLVAAPFKVTDTTARGQVFYRVLP